MKTNLSLKDELLSAIRRIVAKFWAQVVGRSMRLQSACYHANLSTKIGIRSRIVSRMLLSTLLMLTVCIGNVWGQASVGTVLWSEDFSGYDADGVPSGNITNSHTGTTVHGGLTLTYAVSNGSGTTKVYEANLAGGSSPELLVAKSSGTFSCAGISNGGATKITVSYKQNAQNLSCAVSGTGYSGSTSSNTAGTTSFDITVASNAASTFTLTFTAGTKNVRLDGISVSVKTAGSSGSTPTITTSSSMETLTYSEGSPVAQSFTIGGSNLTNTVTVTAPANYEVCKTSGGTYTSSISFTNTEVNAADQTVYIRLESGLSAGNIASSNVTVASSGATTQNVAVTGSVPYTITWMANGSTFETTYVAVGSTLTLPASDPNPGTYSCAGKYFYGWYGDNSSYSHATDAPSIAANGNAVAADKTYYAVFADRSGSGTVTWDKVTSAPSNWSGEYVITRGANAMISDFYSGTSGEFKTAPVTLNGTSTQITSTPTDKMIWIVAKNGNNAQYSFKNKSTGTYAEITGTSSTNAALNASAVWFTISGSSGSWAINSVTNSARCFAYYADRTSFRTYSNSTNYTGDLFKKSGDGYTWSNYETSCSSDPTLNVSTSSLDFGNVASGTYKELTFSLSGSNLTADASINLSGTNSSYYSRTPTSVSFGSGTISPTDITIRYTPGAVGDGHTATITVSSAGADDQTVTLTGNCKASYAVTCSAASNGSVSADKTSNVMAGETVTLTITPSSGYQLSSISAVDASSNTVTLTGTGNSRTFTMPSSNVTVSSSFSVQTDYVLVESTLADYSGEYLIVYHSTFDDLYALSGRSGNQNTNGHGDVTDVTTYYNSGAKSIASNATTDAMKMVIEPAETAGRYTIYWNDDASYLGMTANNTGTGEKLRFITSANLTSTNSYEWAINLVSETTKHRLSVWNNEATPVQFDLQYNTGTSDFRIYKNSQVHPELYKKVETCSKLAAPTGLTASSITQTTVTLSWNSVSNASGYEISLNNGSSWTSTSTNTSYNATGLTAGTTYNWKVRATGDGVTYCAKGNIASSTVTMKNAVTVTYNANEGSGTLPVSGGVVNLTEGDSHTVLGNIGNGGGAILTKDGYTWAGWHSSTTYSSTPAYTVGNSITVNSSITLYANWAPKRDTYIDGVHGASDQYGDGAGYSVPSCSDESQATSGACDVTHYKFIGWALEDADLTDPANIFKGGTKTATGATYYAVWGEEL